MSSGPRAILLAALLVGWVAAACVAARAEETGHSPLRRVNPASWGNDHVGQPLPPYVTGDECLFCHRDIGPAWSDNRHQLTIRPATADEPAVKLLRELAGGEELARETTYLLGSRRITRFLQRSKDYGRLALLATSFVPPRGAAVESSPVARGALQNDDAPHWNAATFGDRCAGCHATAVSATANAFSAIAIDCFACHGDVDLAHTKDVSRVLLSSSNRPPREVVSICGQCHLRGGKSRSSGLPYPRTFVAGDNLFRDFQVDFSDAGIKALPLIDQHVYLNARDVAVFDRSTVTCLACHDVHNQSSEKHAQLPTSTICAVCHLPGADRAALRAPLLPANRLRSRSRVCDY